MHQHGHDLKTELFIQFSIHDLNTGIRERVGQPKLEDQKIFDHRTKIQKNR